MVIVVEPMPTFPVPYTLISGCALNFVGLLIVPLAVNVVAVSPDLRNLCGLQVNVMSKLPASFIVVTLGSNGP